MTHVIEVDHESNVASDGGAELSATGGESEALGRSGTTPYPLGREHIPSSLLAVIG